VAVLLFAAAGVAYATIPDAGGVITGCYDNGSGDLRVIDTDNEKCRADESPLEWQQKGGGAPTYSYHSVQENGGSAAKVFCPAGSRVSGGGATSLDNANGLTQNHPISDVTGVFAWGNTAIGWQAAAENWGPVVAFVICAS
jgi:hypothetical protein